HALEAHDGRRRVLEEAGGNPALVALLGAHARPALALLEQLDRVARRDRADRPELGPRARADVQEHLALGEVALCGRRSADKPRSGATVWSRSRAPTRARGGARPRRVMEPP